MPKLLTRASLPIVKPQVTDPDVLRPPLKWAGGKRWLVPQLRLLFESYRDRRLVEPMCGGLSVALGLNPKEALLNDVNPHLINFYRCLQAGLVSNVVMRNDQELYYEHRERFNSLARARVVNAGKKPSLSKADKERALLFYYLNRTGFNGLCRFNKQGLYNVPFGKYKTINYTVDFSHYQDVFKPWQFFETDFEKLEINKGDFIYADPPYDVEFTQYSKEGFSFEDQERLALWLSKHKGPVVLSNQATERIVRLYNKCGFQIYFLNAPRMISCSGDRSQVQEVLALKGF